MRALAGNFRAPLLDLTGGFDSRALLGAALRVRPRRRQLDVPPSLPHSLVGQVFNLTRRLKIDPTL